MKPLVIVAAIILVGLLGVTIFLTSSNQNGAIAFFGLNSLEDVFITNPLNGNHLVYNGSYWTNQPSTSVNGVDAHQPINSASFVIHTWTNGTGTFYAAQNGTSGLDLWTSTNRTYTEQEAVTAATANGGVIQTSNVQWATAIVLPSNVGVVQNYLGSVAYYGQYWSSHIDTSPSGWVIQTDGSGHYYFSNNGQVLYTSTNTNLTFSNAVGNITNGQLYVCSGAYPSTVVTGTANIRLVIENGTTGITYSGFGYVSDYNGQGTIIWNGQNVTTQLLGTRNTYNYTVTAYPGSTNSAFPTKKMLGLNSTFTPTGTGRVMMMVKGTGINTVNDTGIYYQLAYGTGAVPLNGAASTGTTVGWAQDCNGTLLYKQSYSSFAIVTGLTVGTRYWVDIQFACETGPYGDGYVALYDNEIMVIEF